jgi:chromosome segregation ATPase
LEHALNLKQQDL